jgi:hypothetical protein
MGTGGSFPEVKRPRRDVDHTPPARAEVTNKWSYTSTPPICLYNVDRENFYLFYVYVL